MPAINKKHTRITLLAAAMALACPALLHAQTPSGDVGRALDNNLQVGSGGVNSAAAQPDYRARNDAITGNVSGLGYFHGNVGYRAPGEFRGTTADDSNFRFNAQSYSNPAATGATSSVYRSAAGTTAGDIRAAQFGQSVLIRPATTDGQGGQPTITPYGRSDYGISAQPPGVTAQHDASMLQLQGSPLLGVRSANNPANLDPNAAAVRAGQVAPQPNGITLPNDPDASSDFRLNQQIDPLSRQLSRQPGLLIDSGAGDGSLMSSPAGTRDYSASPRWSPSAELGAQLQARVTNPRIDQTQTLDQRLEQIQARLYSPLGNTSVAPGQDAYLDLLTRIQDQQRRATPTPGTPGSNSGSVPQPPAPAPGSTPAPASGTDINTSSTTPEANPATPAGPQVSTPAAGTSALPANILTSPTTEQLRAAAEARQNQLRARGLPVQESPAAASGGVVKPDASKPDAAKLDAMIAALDHKLPPIATLAPKRDDALSNLLKQAEEDMAASKYFSAEQRYRSALSLNPNAPLAQVGLLHAQLGAGLTRSASLNLRQLLEEHPELIATRYDAKLLPSPERIKAAQSEIDSLIATTARPEPAILLAYLGYQFSTPTLVQYGLNIAQTRAPADPLIPLLQRLWHAPPGSAPGTPPAPGNATGTNSGGAPEPRK